MLFKKNLIQARSFEELLDKAIKAYTNRSIEAAEIIQQLIYLAKKMRDEQLRGIKLNLTEEEIAFYDALADNESAKQCSYLVDKACGFRRHSRRRIRRK
jgi:type I restriction enzyme, R subunit